MYVCVESLGRYKRTIGGALVVMKLFCILTLSWLWCCTTVAIGENQVKDTRDLFILFLIIARESTIISEQKKIN